MNEVPEKVAASVRIGPIEVGPRDKQVWGDLLDNNIDDKSRRCNG